VVGTALSAFGNSMSWLATTYLVYGQTSSVVATALVTLCSAAPSLLLAGRATFLLGRFGAGRVFVAAGALLAILGLIPTILSFTGRLSAASLLGWHLAIGVVVGLAGGAGGMVTRLLAAPGRVTEYNARIARAKSAANIFGLVAGGVILALVGPSWLFFLNMLTYLAPVVPVLSIVAIVTPPAARVSVRQAWAVRRQFAGLRALFLAIITVSVVGSFSIAFAALAQLISPEAWAYSGLQISYVLGGVVVASVLPRVRHRTGWGNLVRAATVIAGVGLLLLAQVTRHIGVPALLFAVACILLLVIGTARSTRATILSAAVQEHVPAHMQAAYLTLFRLPPLAIIPISQVLLGLLVDVTSLAVAFSACGALSLLAVAIGGRLKVVSQINSMYEAHDAASV
jgi:hypothetical protein